MLRKILGIIAGLVVLFVAAFPTRFSFATIVEQLRNVPCKEANGELAEPETYVYWPDTDPDDKEGEALSWHVSVTPFKLETVDAFADHLAKRNEWRKVLQTWDSVLQDDANNAIARARRSVVELRLGDQAAAYRDAKRACKLGAKEGCELAARFAPDVSSKLDAENAQTLATAKPCLPPTAIVHVKRPVSDGRFDIRVEEPASTSGTSQNVSGAEFAKLLNDDYANREWMLRFYYLTPTPRHAYFSVFMGTDGKVTRVTETGAMD